MRNYYDVYSLGVNQLVGSRLSVLVIAASVMTKNGTNLVLLSSEVSLCITLYHAPFRTAQMKQLKTRTETED